jgi:hypothetical protein
MHSSGENRCKRKNDSGKRGEYRKFDEASSRMRDTLIQSCAERVIAHAAGDGGSCRQGFVKELVDELNQRAPLLEFTCNNINNKVRIIKGQGEAEERLEVSLAIPFQVIRKKTKLRELILSAKRIKDKINSKKFKLTGKDLLVLARYKLKRKIKQYSMG